MSLRTRTTAALALTAALAVPFAGAASAHGKPATVKAACTISADDKAAALDALHADQAKLAGHKLTEAEKQALHAAIKQLVQTARDAKLAPAVRAAKVAELKDLRAQLDAATTDEQRVALRTQISALRVELKDARLTKAERAQIHTQAKQMYAALRDKPTKADRAVILADMKAQVAKLRCTVA